MDLPKVTQFQIVSADSNSLTFTPKCVHDYENCRFEAGIVEGHPHDTIYMWIQKPHAQGETGLYYRVLLQPCEAATLIWILSGVLAMKEDPDENKKNKFFEWVKGFIPWE